MHRIPLRYQATEYDCGTAAVLNAITRIVDFSSIPPIFMKEIFSICLNEYNDKCLLGGKGTSIDALTYLAKWVNNYSLVHNFPLKCDVYYDDDVTFCNDYYLLNLLQKQSAAIVLYCILFDEHYVTLTGADNDYIYLFDPYYWEKDYGEPSIQRINEPLYANRKVPIEHFENTKSNFYNIHQLNNKFALVFMKRDKIDYEELAKRIDKYMTVYRDYDHIYLLYDKDNKIQSIVIQEIDDKLVLWSIDYFEKSLNEIFRIFKEFAPNHVIVPFIEDWTTYEIVKAEGGRKIEFHEEFEEENDFEFGSYLL